MSTITIQVPDSLNRHVARLSAQDGISVDQFFASAAGEKLAALEAEEYIARRAAQANDKAFEAVLAKVPSTPPTEEWDRKP